jgi:hypothetical protein
MMRKRRKGVVIRCKRTKGIAMMKGNYMNIYKENHCWKFVGKVPEGSGLEKLDREKTTRSKLKAWQKKVKVQRNQLSGNQSAWQGTETGCFPCSSKKKHF